MDDRFDIADASHRSNVKNTVGVGLILLAIAILIAAIVIVVSKIVNDPEIQLFNDDEVVVDPLFDPSASIAANVAVGISDHDADIIEIMEKELSSEKDLFGSDNEKSSLEALSLNFEKNFRSSFAHGPKPSEYQKYIVLHDTEGSGSANSVINWWDSNGQGVAAHFIINKDGSIVQCVDMDTIAHHAGFGDTGHNVYFGVADESRDDKVGTKSIGSWASDYGMNSYSIGIELVHVGGEGDYPSAQLEALDALIAYIDAYYGFQSQIIDHKDWRTGNSDTSPEFARYFQNYKDHRTHL